MGAASFRLFLRNRNRACVEGFIAPSAGDFRQGELQWFGGSELFVSVIVQINTERPFARRNILDAECLERTQNLPSFLQIIFFGKPLVAKQLFPLFRVFLVTVN